LTFYTYDLHDSTMDYYDYVHLTFYTYDLHDSTMDYYDYIYTASDSTE